MYLETLSSFKLFSSIWDI